ncbi:MAG TPA: AAA family ATPase [Deltaproteobacteria bacterium]|nr:AAA family ATPase [Deltaproteobacteria bacterium]
MDIRINRISLRNFKGIKALDVELGDATAIHGRNATGKTTIFDGFLWCLFGKDSMNKSDFEIKPLDRQGNPAHNLEHSVEVFLLVDGAPVALKKVYSEKYTRKRGAAQAEFTGHSTDYWYNGVPCKEKEYAERVRGIVDEKVFRLLTDPRYFNEVMHWQERRNILMEICGDVSVQDVIASDSGLAGLEAVLNGHGIEDAKKIIASQKAKINDELKKVPVRIDEARLSMTEVASWVKEIPGRLEELGKQRADIESEIADLRNGGAVSAKRIELQEIEAEIREKRNAHENKKAERIRVLEKEQDGLADARRVVDARVKDLEVTIANRKRELASCEEQIEYLRKEWIAIDAQESTDPTTCPTCKQPLLETMIKEARENFNKAKAEKLSVIEARGKERNAKINELREAIEKAEEELKLRRSDQVSVSQQIEALKKRIDELRAQQPDLSELEAKKASIEAEIDNISQAEQGIINEVRARMEKVIAEIRELEAELQKAEVNKRAEARIADLEIQEKDLAAKFEELEGQLFLCENFIRRKVDLLNDQINSRFKLVKFQLFRDQINGGLEEVCETSLNGVPYNSINNAGRIQAGMDIIRTLQAHYGVTGPIWIDNRESIVDLPEMDCQVISLVVTERDKTLRIESEGETKTMKKAGGM